MKIQIFSKVPGLNSIIDYITEVSGTFVDLIVSHILTLSGSIPSTSPATGVLVSNGGIGISNTTNSSSPTNGGTLTTAGGVAIGKDIYSGGDYFGQSQNSAVNLGDWTLVSGNPSLNFFSSQTGSDTVVSSRIQAYSGSSGSLSGTLEFDATNYIFGSSGDVFIENTSQSGSSSSGALVVSGGIGISKTTNASSITDGGSLTTAGGIAVAQDIYSGGDYFGNSQYGAINLGQWNTTGANPSINFFTSNSGSDSIPSSRIQAYGGDGTVNSGTLEFDAATYVFGTSGSFVIDNTTDSTSPTTGALVVYGGVGIGKNVHTGASIYCNSADAQLFLGSYSGSNIPVINFFSSNTGGTSVQSAKIQVYNGSSLQNSGTMEFDGAGFVFSNGAITTTFNGTTSTPAYGFSNSTNTGMLYDATNGGRLVLAAGGTASFWIYPNGHGWLQVLSASLNIGTPFVNSGNPALNFFNQNTGSETIPNARIQVYGGSSTIDSSTMEFDGAGFVFSNGAITTTFNGTISTPAYGFSNSMNTGMLYDATNGGRLVLSSGGNASFWIYPSGAGWFPTASAQLNIGNPFTNSANPAINFFSHNTGSESTSNARIQVYNGSSSQNSGTMEFDASLFTFINQIQAPPGGFNTPEYSFTGHGNNGMWYGPMPSPDNATTITGFSSEGLWSFGISKDGCFIPAQDSGNSYTAALNIGNPYVTGGFAGVNFYSSHIGSYSANTPSSALLSYGGNSSRFSAVLVFLAGSFYFDGGAITTIFNGTAGTPAYGFTNSNNTGMLYDSTNGGRLAFTSGGNVGFFLYSSGAAWFQTLSASLNVGNPFTNGGNPAINFFSHNTGSETTSNARIQVYGGTASQSTGTMEFDAANFVFTPGAINQAAPTSLTFGSFVGVTSVTNAGNALVNTNGTYYTLTFIASVVPSSATPQTCTFQMTNMQGRTSNFSSIASVVSQASGFANTAGTPVAVENIIVYAIAGTKNIQVSFTSYDNNAHYINFSIRYNTP